MFPNYNGGYRTSNGMKRSFEGDMRSMNSPGNFPDYFGSPMNMHGPGHMNMQGPGYMNMQGPGYMNMQGPGHMNMSGFMNMQGDDAYRMNCGELRIKDVGKFVEISGKLHKVQVERFVQLRDQYGTTQLVIPQDRMDLLKRFARMPLQSFIAVRGHVRRRPNKANNERLNTGDIEVVIDDVMMVKVNKATEKPPPPLMPRVPDAARAYSTTTISSEEYHKFHKLGLVRKLNERTLNIADAIHKVNEKVTLYGWVEKQIGNSRFFILRDGYGKIQCLVPKDDPNLTLPTASMTNQILLCVTGVVKNRPTEQINPSSISGHVELVLERINVLTPGDPEDDIVQDVDMNDTTKQPVNSHTTRTHHCGEIRLQHVGQRVTLAGWMQFRRLDKFLLLRDAYGLSQCVMPEARDDIILSDIPLESVVRVTGVVVARPPNSSNDSMLTGEVEINIDELEVLNKAVDIPFNLKTYNRPKESTRMQYRYIDLRYPEMQNNLRLRAKMIHNMRCFLVEKKGFVEVETPTLFCRTPGGAREFVVPTHHPGLFYSLVQSPQQYKQMLMAGGIDRYFQVARCYRDEATRPDRQPEFTQLDLEMSFTDVDGVLSLIEQLINSTYPATLKPPPYLRMSYREALDLYGTDKPDITFDMKLKNVTSVFKTPTDSDQFGAFCLACEKKYGKLTTKMRETIRQLKNKFNIKIIDDVSGITKFFGAEAEKNFNEMTKLEKGASFVVGFGINDDVCKCLGEIRLQLAEELKSKNLLKLNNANMHRPIWIVDFPLMLRAPGGGLETCHHPFTAPHPEDLDTLDTEPLRVRSLAYDLVINGAEIGGGSVRAHDAALQQRLLQMLNIKEEPLQHLIDALKSGCPPHAGIALGLDRLVSIACQAESIRDVIAFPKSHDQRDPLSGAPQPLDPADLEYYHLTAAGIPLPQDNTAEPPSKVIKIED